MREALLAVAGSFSVQRVETGDLAGSQLIGVALVSFPAGRFENSDNSRRSGRPARLMTVPLLTARGVGKRFGALVAVEAIDLDISAGDLLALVGDNGAGKSTFIKILAGAHPQSEGEIRMNGKPVAFATPQDASSAGVATIFQELALSENLSITENVYLGREIVRRIAGIPFLRRREMKQRVAALLKELDAHVTDADAIVGTLSGGQRQAVAICRALNLQAAS